MEVLLRIITNSGKNEVRCFYFLWPVHKILADEKP